VEQARREFKEDIATLAKAGRVRHRREIWFANLTVAAKILPEPRLALRRLICQQPPRSTANLARLARRRPAFSSPSSGTEPHRVPRHPSHSHRPLL